MNDLDLHAVLQRDADLVGQPAPDLLDQLRRRRQHQGRQRAALFAATLGVVVIAAGIPLGGALMKDSASRTATDPTPAVSTPAIPTTPATPATTWAPPAVVTVPSAVLPVEPAPETTPVADVAPQCPDAASLLSRQPQDQDVPLELNPSADAPRCSGSWSVVHFSEATESDGGIAYVAVFRYVEGAWTAVDRGQSCDSGEVPDDLFTWVCDSD